MKRKIRNSIYNGMAAIPAKISGFGVCIVYCLLFLSACGEQKELVNMGASVVNDKWTVVWEGRTYVPFCVVSKSDCGEQIGYVNGDTDDRVSAYQDYSPEEWLVSWMPMDGGAILLKEETVVDIPEGLEAEY